MIEQIAVMCRREAKIWQQCADLAQEDQPEEYTASEEVEGMLWTAAADYLETMGPRMERMREALEEAVSEINSAIYGIVYGTLADLNEHTSPRLLKRSDDLTAALAEPTPDELAEWQGIREKAELLDYLTSGRFMDVRERVHEWLDMYQQTDLTGQESLDVLRAAKKEDKNASK